MYEYATDYQSSTETPGMFPGLGSFLVIFNKSSISILVQVLILTKSSLYNFNFYIDTWDPFVLVYIVKRKNLLLSIIIYSCSNIIH